MLLTVDHDSFGYRPIFGETKVRDRISFLIITIPTAIFVIATFASIFINNHINGVYIFLSICLIFLFGSHFSLAFWYKAGDLEPRFRNMLYFNSVIIILLCICSNMIISERYR